MKWIFSIFFVAILAQNVLSQSTPSVACRYQNSTYGYTCSLSLFNPDGFDNFTAIEGDHLAGKINIDVRRVVSHNSTTTINIPSILCELFRFLNEMTIINSFISDVGPNSLRGCTVITSLNLMNNKILSLAPNAFESNRFLKELYLDENYLMELPSGIFRPLVSLQILQMNNNFLQVIQTEVFGINLSLTWIDFSYNMIIAMSSALIDNTSIQSLLFYGNICATGNFYNLPKENLTLALRPCLDNYAALQIPTTPLPTPPPGSCGEGNIFDRVCELEEISSSQKSTIQVLLKEVEVLTERVNELSSRPGTI